MSTSTIVVLVVLALPRGAAAILVRMNVILNAMLANKTTFPTPPVALATAQAHVTALGSAEADAKAKKAGARQVRDDALALVKQDAQQLHAYVQQLCNASPTEAATIAGDAAMTLKKRGAHPKADIAVKQKLSGEVHVIARSTKGASAHEWQMTTDGGKTWTTLASTNKAVTTVTGITPGTMVQVRHRIVVKKTGPTDWVTSSPFAVS
jgi:hypothetical protein